MMESRDHIGSGSGSGSVKGWHAAELAKFKAFHDCENNDHDIQNTKWFICDGEDNLEFAIG
ncbi:hypothetical protein DVH24_027142 [Malus domestica]|uniref:Uncharacterized protein n=1 Tax=Malus domestica TaxID=3750 RepID=A0A498ISH7_MALDO|nr:hypothetical protein DVH24_027142 [Malus domestica]